MYRDKKFSFSLTAITIAIGFSMSSNVFAQNAQVQAALNQFANNATQREAIRAIAIICPTAGRASQRFQQDCNSLVGAAFAGNGNVRRALAALVADQTPVAANRAFLAGAGEILSARISGGFGKMGGPGLMGMTSMSNQNSGWNFAADEGTSFGPWSLFGSVENAQIDRDASANQDGFDSSAYGALVGIDRRVGDNGVFGGAFRYRKTSADYTSDSGELDQRDLIGDVYLSLRGQSPWYFTALGSVGKRNSDQTRRANYTVDATTTVSQSYLSSFDTNLLSGALTLGYQANFDAFNLDPYFQLEYARQKVDGYDERASNTSGNGAGWAVQVADVTGSTSSASIGTNASWAISGSNGVYQPFIGLRWTQVIDSQTDNVGLRYLGDVGPRRETFFATADREDRNYGTLMLGLSAQFADGIAGFIRLSRHFSESRYSNTGAQLGFRVEF